MDDSIEKDPVLEAVLSDSAYDEVRVKRRQVAVRPPREKLAIQSVLLAALALLVPVYALYPTTVAGYVDHLNPVAAAPKIALLGLFTVGVEVGTGVLLAGATMYRYRCRPLSKKTARTVIDVETFASYVGLGTGGFAAALTVGLFLLGLGGQSTVETYVGLVGANPFVASGTGITVAVVGVAATAGSLLLAVLGAALLARA